MHVLSVPKHTCIFLYYVLLNSCLFMKNSSHLWCELERFINCEIWVQVYTNNKGTKWPEWKSHTKRRKFILDKVSWYCGSVCFTTSCYHNNICYFQIPEEKQHYRARKWDTILNSIRYYCAWKKKIYLIADELLPF